MTDERTAQMALCGMSVALSSHPMVWAPTRFAQELARHLAARVNAGMRVMELGTGSGVLSIVAGLRGAEVVGLDVNEHAVRLSARNWAANGLPTDGRRFRQSDLLSAITAEELGSFDLAWSNPPVLPAIEGVKKPPTRDRFEIAGRDGRRVLDAMLTQAGPLLRAAGSMLTIATSLQGWARTERLLQAYWGEWSVVETLQLELTAECNATYVDWWRARQQADGQRRVYRKGRGDRWRHDVWIVEASHPTGTAPC